jgi:hypothetical protein
MTSAVVQSMLRWRHGHLTVHVFKREKCSCLLMYFLENGSRGKVAASVGSSSGEQHGHDDTCDHHHHRADRFRGRRLVRAGTVVVRQRDQPRTTHPAREPRGGSAAGLGHVAQAVARAVEQRLAMSAPMALAVIEELSSNADISPKVRLVASKALLTGFVPPRACSKQRWEDRHPECPWPSLASL